MALPQPLPVSEAEAIASPRPTHVRWFPILAMVAVGTMINYLDRTVLGIAAPSMSRDLGLSAAQLGLVFSAFSWSYAALQIPGGIFLDRVGTRVTLHGPESEERVYTLLGPWDSQPELRILSHESELATSLLGKEVGDAVAVEGKSFRVAAIEPFR